MPLPNVSPVCGEAEEPELVHARALHIVKWVKKRSRAEEMQAYVFHKKVCSSPFPRSGGSGALSRQFLTYVIKHNIPGVPCVQEVHVTPWDHTSTFWGPRATAPGGPMPGGKMMIGGWFCMATQFGHGNLQCNLWQGNSLTPFPWAKEPGTDRPSIADQPHSGFAE